jgi:hypothetical protein
LFIMQPRRSAARKVAARKPAARKAATRTVVRSRASSSGQYVIFDLPLKPKHRTEEQIRRAVKATA